MGCAKTTGDIAQEAGLSRQWVRKFFRGEVDNPTISTLTTLAKVVGEKNPAWWVWPNQERRR